MGQKRENKLPPADDSIVPSGPESAPFGRDGDSMITAAGQALPGNEQRYGAFFETSMDAILLTSPDGRIRAANPAACRLFGMTEKELTDMGRSGVVDVTDPNLPRMLAEREREGKVSGELTFIRKDGTKFLAEISSALFTDSTGEVRTTIIIRDITRWNKLLQALRENETKFRQIYEEGPYGMALIGSDLTFLMANRTFCRISGYSEPELKRLRFHDITHPEDVNLGLDAYRRLADGEIDVFRTEKRYVRKDGCTIWASITVTSNRDKEGRHLYSLAIVEDITERKSTEENVRLLNNRLRLLIEAIQELSMSTSLESIMKTVSTTVRSLLNADGATFILRDGDQSWYVDEDAIAPLWKGQRFPMTECVSGWSMMNRQVAVVFDIYTDGRVPVKIYESTFVRSMALAPIRISDPLGAVGAYWKDLYSPAPAEVQLLQTLADAAAKAVENMQLIDGLEKKINERTAELQTVNDELEAFSYSVSHDLRAPLRHIHGFSEILLNNYSEELSEEAARYLGTIIGAAKQMGVLIDDLLSLSRTARAELRKTIVSMETVVNEALSTLSQQLKGREIEWQADSLPSCYCDARLIRQVWINLIDNAVKYTRRKKKAVIKIGHRTENGESVYFISDNGVGFDMQYAGKLFGVFQRMHSSNDFEGTGVGLANVHRIITRHGGKIWAEAKPDRGATFFFKLPMQ